MIILTWAVNRKVVSEAVRSRGIPKCGNGLPSRESYIIALILVICTMPLKSHHKDIPPFFFLSV